MKRGGLGRNLTALLGSTTANALINDVTDQNMAMAMLAVEQLQPGKYQPRTSIDDANLNELAESIKKQGLLQPIIVRPIADANYEIIAGERRWRASQLAGLSDVPVIIRDVSDETAVAMALIENLQREDLNPMDQARAMARLANEFDLTHQQIADLLAKSRTSVSNFLRLLSLSDCVKNFVEVRDLDMGHARALLMLDENTQTKLADKIINQKLSVRETEKLVAQLKENKDKLATLPKQAAMPQTLQTQVQNLEKQLKTKVKIKKRADGKGSLIIHYQSWENLATCLGQMLNEEAL